MSEPSKLVQATGAMGVATLASRVLGLAREIVFAAFLGQSLAASAFFFAFTIPNLFRRLLGEGALTAAFIPTFSEKLNREGVESARRAANIVASTLLVACVVLTLAVIGGVALARLALPVSDNTHLILSLTQWMMPYLIFVCMAALAMAILNTRGHFFVPAFSPVLLNVVMIGSVFTLCPRFGGDLDRQVYGLAVGVLLGGLVQWFYQLPSLWREGFPYRWDFQPRDPVVKRVVGLMLPSVLGVAVFQVNVITSGALAFFVGDYARAALNYADRLMELPMGIFGVSVATYALPALSALHAQDKQEEFKSALTDALRLLWFVTIPAAVGLMILAEPIIRLLFERGKFDATATGHAATALLYLAPGLVAYATVNVLARAFYAMHDTKTPMKIGVMAMVVNVFLAAILMWPLGVGGLALANTLSSAMNALALFTALRGRVGWSGGRTLFESAARTAGATLLMAGACWMTFVWLGRQSLGDGFGARAALALGPVGVGVVTFGLATLLVRAPEVRSVWDALGRRRPPGGKSS
jgi:putative peptidoglycan lipid II flippase